MGLCHGTIRHRLPTALFAAVCSLATGDLTAQGVRADTLLWQCEAPDDSADEFGDFPKAPMTRVAVRERATSRAESRIILRDMKANTGPALEIGYNLKTIPHYGTEFSLKMLDAPRWRSSLS